MNSPDSNNTFNIAIAIAIAIGNSLYSASPLRAGWDEVKNAVSPVIGPSSEYDAAYRQPCASAGWDDGVHISRDGLHLYCTYVPGDFLSWFLNSGNPFAFTPYLRGPDYGMDMTAGDTSWVHSDILYSTRASIDDPFPAWQLSGAARPFFTEGAPLSIRNGSGGLAYFLFTSIAGTAGPAYHPDIWWIRDTGMNPSGIGKALPAPVNSDSTEDNPHLEIMDDSTMVLFFESADRPGGPGGLDLWYTISTDTGATWTDPEIVTSLCSERDEEQPHLFRDNNVWYLYYTAVPAGGLEAIYRARQSVPGNWDSWTDPELIIGTDGTFSVGEASLTDEGDISFGVGYINPDGTDTDRYDVDPWFLPRKRTGGWMLRTGSAPAVPSTAERTVYSLCGRRLPTDTQGPGVVIVHDGRGGWRKEARLE